MTRRKKFRASQAEIEEAQRNFDFLIPFKKGLLNLPEVLKVIGRERDFVRELLNDGRLEAYGDNASGERKSYRVTRRSVLVYFARTAQYDPAHFVGALEELLETLSNEQLQRLIIKATRIRTERPL